MIEVLSGKSVQEFLRYLTHQLEDDDVPAPAREARILLAHAMDVDVDRMTLLMHDIVEDAAAEVACVNASRRMAGEPMSHIIGYRDFYGRRFWVSNCVLDPRPDTETLVEAALSEQFEDVLDLGTGTGAIVLTLLAERPDAIAIATDLSTAALPVAIHNARNLGVIDRVGIIESDWFQAVGGTFDLIVSNPPYIAASEMADLQPEVRDHEPRIALTDEADGLTHYRHIIAHHDPYLAPGGRLMFEIGPTQAKAVCDMMANAGLADITVIPDLDGRDRVVWGRKPRKTG